MTVYIRAPFGGPARLRVVGHIEIPERRSSLFARQHWLQAKRRIPKERARSVYGARYVYIYYGMRTAVIRLCIRCLCIVVVVVVVVGNVSTDIYILSCIRHHILCARARCEGVLLYTCHTRGCAAHSNVYRCGALHVFFE